MEDLIRALQIFLKYGNPDFPTQCEHDTLYVNIDPNLVSDDDKAVLKDFGFHPYDEMFKSYRYGSA